MQQEIRERTTFLQKKPKTLKDFLNKPRELIGKTAIDPQEEKNIRYLIEQAYFEGSRTRIILKGISINYNCGGQIDKFGVLLHNFDPRAIVYHSQTENWEILNE
ncbi:hypothetical protein ISS08_01560 [Candidatus Pacearchaeota archaeon]|nr:hypothetical protein [Candidatus Pacearchaeota archaeon]